MQLPCSTCSCTDGSVAIGTWQTYLVMSRYGFVKSSVNMMSPVLLEIAFRMCAGNVYVFVGPSGRGLPLDDGSHCAQKSTSKPSRKTWAVPRWKKWQGLQASNAGSQCSRNDTFIEPPHVSVEAHLKYDNDANGDCPRTPRDFSSFSTRVALCFGFLLVYRGSVGLMTCTWSVHVRDVPSRSALNTARTVRIDTEKKPKTRHHPGTNTNQ